MFAPIVTAIILGLLIVALVKEVGSPASLMFSAMVIFMLLGVVDTQKALSGFSNPAMLTVAALFVVAEGLERTHALSLLSNTFFGNSANLTQGLGRILGISGIISIFLNNTTVVTVMTPAVLEWTTRRQFSVSHFLMPISFIVILGGLCSLIGTSTNLLVNGLMIGHQIEGMSMFELAWVGVPLLIIGWFYLTFLGRYILPGKKDLVSQIISSGRNFICDVIVTAECKLIGKTIEEAGLRHLEGLFLSSIEREGEFIGSVSPRERLHAMDRLIFAGKVETLSQIQQIPGIVPSYQEYFNMPQVQSRLKLYEVVVSYSSPLVDKNLRDVKFRSRYNAAVLAVHRADTDIHSKLGDIIFCPGDVLLVEAEDSFYEHWRYSKDFFLIAKSDGKTGSPSKKTYWALGIVLVMVLLTTLTNVPILHSAFIAAMAMVFSKCLTLEDARETVAQEFNILVLIASAFGVGYAIEESGLAQLIADLIIHHVGNFNPTIALGAVLLLTTFFTEFVTNNAAAAIMFPVGMASAQILSVNPRPFGIAIAVAASLCFITPFGYQTNLIVMGPGNYQMKDYFRLGITLKVIALLVSLVIIPVVWPF
ncbi:SLC13 family permease [Deltaproteobacteria bacterium TL4]